MSCRSALGWAVWWLTGCPAAPQAPAGELPGDPGLSADAVSESDHPADAGTAADLPANLSAERLGWDPALPGPLGVGYRSLTLAYTPPWHTAPRELQLAVWYPTAATSGPHPAYGAFVPERASVLLDAPPLAAGPLPVLLYSHGSGGFPEATWFLCEHFASHGWLVVAPSHPGNTYENLLDPVTADIYALRPLDLRAALDALEALPQTDPLASTAGEEVVVSGHSFGGYTSLALAGAVYPVAALDATCAGGAQEGFCAGYAELRDRFAAGFADPRVDAALLFASGGAPQLGAGGVAAIEVPVLLMTGALDKSTPNASQGDPIWSALDGADDLRVDLQTAGHHTFAVTCEVLAGFGTDDGCGEGFLDPRTARALINTYSLAFARARLWQDASVEAVIAGTRSLHPSARVARHPAAD